MLEVLKDFKQVGGVAVERGSISAPGNLCIYDGGNAVAFKMNIADLTKAPADGCHVDTLAHALLLLVEKGPQTPNSEKVRGHLLDVVNTLFKERKDQEKIYEKHLLAEKALVEKVAKEAAEKEKHLS